jgi:hypothetical protein
VQILPGDAAVALHLRSANRIQQDIFANPQTGGSTLLLPVRSSTFTNQTFANQISQTRETKIRATNLLREDHCKPESFRMCFRMKCVGKTCCAT